MSSNWVEFIPVDPRFVPTAAAAEQAAAIVRAADPKASEVSSEVEARVVFRGCWGNFERVLCPGCKKEIEIGRWVDWMDEDYGDEDGFRLQTFTTPCCERAVTLNELEYEWPQGFSRYVLSVMDPGKADLEEMAPQLEASLGCRLRVIWRHF